MLMYVMCGVSCTATNLAEAYIAFVGSQAKGGAEVYFAGPGNNAIQLLNE